MLMKFDQQLSSQRQLMWNQELGQEIVKPEATDVKSRNWINNCQERASNANSRNVISNFQARGNWCKIKYIAKAEATNAKLRNLISNYHSTKKIIMATTTVKNDEKSDKYFQIQRKLQKVWQIKNMVSYEAALASQRLAQPKKWFNLPRNVMTLGFFFCLNFKLSQG